MSGMAPESSPLVVPSTGRRDAIIAIAAGLVVLAFVFYGIMHMAQPVVGNKLTGTVIEKSFTPGREVQVSFSGKHIEGTKHIDGEYILKVRVEAENRTFEVPVEKEVFESKKVGDSLTFLRPPSEQR